MKDCILSLIWPRQGIFDFFKDHGCTNHELELIRRFKDENISRSRMIDTVFDSLATRADGGIGQFRAMLKALTEWSHFDPYYFEALRKLDKKVAERQLSHLRQLVELRDARIREDRRRREDAERKAQSPTENRDQLLTRFIELYSGRMDPRKRGYALETLLMDIGKMERLQVTHPFRCIGEQIDGGLKYDGENYLVEAKWHDSSASTTPLYTFAQKVEGKMYGRGIFVSVNGFSVDPVRGLVSGKALRTVLVDGEDLALSLEGHLTFTKMLDEKIRAAQLKGQIYVHPLTKISKVS